MGLGQQQRAVGGEDTTREEPRSGIRWTARSIFPRDATAENNTRTRGYILGQSGWCNFRLLRFVQYINIIFAQHMNRDRFHAGSLCRHVAAEDRLDVGHARPASQQHAHPPSRCWRPLVARPAAWPPDGAPSRALAAGGCPPGSLIAGGRPPRRWRPPGRQLKAARP